MLHKCAEKELILIAPYVKLNDTLYELLKSADERGIEILLVYRENKIQPDEKLKLFGLKNLSLFFHPEVHAKCYFNEKQMVITSMNFYEYSIENSRELGILIDFDKAVA